MLADTLYKAFSLCSFTYIRDVITKIKINIYGEP